MVTGPTRDFDPAVLRVLFVTVLLVTAPVGAVVGVPVGAETGGKASVAPATETSSIDPAPGHVSRAPSHPASDDIGTPTPNGTDTNESRAEGATVYVGTGNGTLYAVNATTGTREWTVKQASDIESSPTVVNGTVYVGSDDESLHVVDAATGIQRWTFETDGWVHSSPTVINGTVYVGSWDRTLYAVDATTGTQEWAVELAYVVESSPNVVDGTVYVGSDLNLYAMDAATGTREWSAKLSSRIHSSPTVVNGTVYIASGFGSVYAFDADDGARQWTINVSGVITSSPTVVNGTVYVGASAEREAGRTLHALDSATGAKQWTVDTHETWSSSPTVFNGTVYIGERGSLLAVDASDGTRQWRSQLRGGLMVSPTVANGTVYVGSRMVLNGSSRLYAIDAVTGIREWAFGMNTSVGASPTVVATPSNGDSVDSRVRLGTLGHHDAWARRAADDGPSDRPTIEKYNWTTETAGNANATVHNRTALEFRVYQCSYANATADLGRLTGMLRWSAFYNVTADGWYEISEVTIHEDGERIYDTTLARPVGGTETGWTDDTLPVDGNVSVTVGIRPSDFCDNGDHGNTYLRLRNLTFTLLDGEKPNLTVRTTNPEVAPGENATVNVTFEAGDVDLDEVNAQMEFGEPVDEWQVVAGDWANSDRYFSAAGPDAGENLAASFTVALPNGTAPGDYDIRLEPGYTLNGTEYDLDPVNATVTVTATGQDGVDLTVPDVNLPLGGAERRLTFTVNNTGARPAEDVALDLDPFPPAPFEVTFGDRYVNDGGEWDLTTSDTVQDWRIEEIPARTKRQPAIVLAPRDFDTPGSNISAGTYRTDVRLRANGSVVASDTLNVRLENRTRKEIELEVDIGRGRSGLPIGGVEPGGTLPVDFRVTNTGDVNITDLRVRVRYAFPESFSIGATSAGGGAWNVTTGLWGRAVLAPGETAAPALEILVPPEASEGTIHALVAAASDENGTQLDSDGGLFRVVNRSTTNVAPTAAFTTNVTTPVVGEPIRFNASASTDPDGDTLEYRWDFDGDRAIDRTGEQVTHRYADPGKYSVALIVDDGQRSNATTRTLSVEQEEEDDPEDPDGPLDLRVEDITVLEGGEAIMEVEIGNSGSGALSNVSLEVGEDTDRDDNPFRPSNDGTLPAGLRIVGYEDDGGVWNRSSNTWSVTRLGADERATPGLNLAVAEYVSGDSLELPLRATVDGEVVATESVTVNVLPVFNGLFPPRVDAQFAGREWTEGHEQSVTLVSQDEAVDDVQGRIHVKTTDGDLYLGLRVSGERWFPPPVLTERLRKVRIKLDRDGSDSVSEGDVRLTIKQDENLDVSSFRIDAVEVFRNGEFSEVPLPSPLVTSFAAAPDPDVPQDTIAEFRIPIGLFDELFGDPAARESPGERIGVSVAVETVRVTDITGTDPDSTESREYRVIDMDDRGAAYPITGIKIPRDRWSSELTAPRIDSELDHVEIMQAVQYPNNSLSTVRGKDTLGRAFVTHNRSATAIRVDFEAWDTSSSLARYLGTATTTFQAPPSFDRTRRGDSANLELPADWTTHENLTLRASTYPLQEVDVSGANDVVVERKEFVETHDLVVYYVPINKGTRSDPEISYPNRDDAAETLEGMYPMADARFVPLPWELIGTFPNPNNQRQAIIRALNRAGQQIQDSRARAQSGPPVPDQTYGIVDVRGLSDPSWVGAFKDVSAKVVTGSSLAALGVNYPGTIAHEINHNIGSNTWGRHVGHSDPEKRRGVTYGCGVIERLGTKEFGIAVGGDGAWQNRYDDGQIHAVGWAPANSNNLGQDGDIIAPSTGDVMTYCTPNRWISDYRWERLTNRLENFEPGVPIHPSEQDDYDIDTPIHIDPPLFPISPIVPPGSLPLSSAELSETSFATGSRTEADRTGSTVRVVSGTVFENESGLLEPSFEQPGKDTITRNPSANATIRLRVTEQDGTTKTVPIATGFPDGENLTRRPFSTTVPDNGTVRRIDLVDTESGRVLDSIVAGNWTLDRASIRTPERFERGTTTELDIDLETTNVSADQLYRKVLYSPAPETGFWYPYRQPFRGGTVNATFTTLPGSERARFLLLISDGLRTEFVTSDAFTVPHRPPRVTIDRSSPVTDESTGSMTVETGRNTEPAVPASITATVGGTVSIDAQAQTETGRALEGKLLQWIATDTDGTVVAKDSGTFDHRFRTPGEYRVRVVAIDPRSGLTSTDTVQVNVSTGPVPDNATVAAFEAAINETVSGVPELDTSPEELEVLVDPGETQRTSLSVAETGGQASIIDGNVAASTLRNGGGTNLSAAGLNLSVESGRFSVGPGGRTRVNATVRFPRVNHSDGDVPILNDVPDDEPTRFDGTFRVRTGNAGSRAVNASVLVLDTELRNVSLVDADRTVEGIHVDRVGFAAVVDGEWPQNVPTRGVYGIRGSGSGTVTLRVSGLSEPSDMAVVVAEDSGRHTVDTSTGATSVTFTINMTEPSKLVALVDRSERSDDRGDGGDGGGQPGEAPGGEVEISNWKLLNRTVPAGQPVVAQIDLANYDPARGTIVLNLSANGSIVTERTVAVGASTERTAYLQHEFTEPGTYAIAVNGVPLGTVTVVARTPTTATASPTPTRSPTGTATGTPGSESPTGTEPRTRTTVRPGPTTGDDGAGFGGPVVLVSMALAVLALRRRRRN